MRTLGIIPARGGSKGLPGKNLAIVGGMPLVWHAVKCAQMTGSITSLVCSTDDEEIAGVAMRAGAEVHDMRPKHLSTDTASVIDVLDHELHQAQLRGDEYDAVCLISPTTPLRMPSDIDRVVMAVQNESPMAAAITRCEWNPWLALEDVEGQVRLALRADNPWIGDVAERQAYPTAYRIAGSVYCWQKEHLGKDWLVKRFGGVEIPSLRAVDIDTEDDLRRARALVKSGEVVLPWL